MKALLEGFIKGLAGSTMDVYNEFSMQHELGIFLRANQPGKRIEFERNVKYFGYQEKFTKKEIDIVVHSGGKCPQLECAVEIKYPRNGQYPEQMYKFCEDIAFLEELRNAGCPQAYFLALADKKPFYQGKKTGIYAYFRSGTKLVGAIKKPTGQRGGSVNIRGVYAMQWEPVSDPLRYLLISI